MIDFIEEQHIYLKDGIITPSVSEILHFIFPDKYKNVSQIRISISQWLDEIAAKRTALNSFDFIDDL